MSFNLSTEFRKPLFVQGIEKDARLTVKDISLGCIYIEKQWEGNGV